MKGSLSSEAYVKGIIKIKEMADGEEKKKLILWLDVGKVLTDMLAAAKA